MDLLIQICFANLNISRHGTMVLQWVANSCPSGLPGSIPGGGVLLYEETI